MSDDPEALFLAFRQRLSRYGSLTDTTFAALRNISTVRHYPAGASLLELGEIAHERFYVYSGLVVSLYASRNGNPHLKNFFVADELAGSVASLLGSTPSAFALVAREDTTVVAWQEAPYQQLVTRCPDLNQQYRRHIEASWIIRNEQRQLAFATLTAAERYVDFLSEYPDLEQRVSQRDVAAYLGITPTQLSRIRRKVYQQQ
ncbi:Crp/Fnr family transcriptional regulator [Lewinella sp. 4G2]|uniref:Crp/Fnr family transcriptional regulator n=1 Tax=Lewinella sp. 4G2 TaxID=1803372 RepID=UPI0007B48C06|nr:Crp/Fnr family transcriptional regulator [Lewinella sp. 4G2]OAV43343.1 hypothetical protein A3850_002015 [Lewinella sp. 4G2]